MENKLFVPHGHFYSPFPADDDVDLQFERVSRCLERMGRDSCLRLPGVAIDDSAILAEWQRMLPFMETIPFPLEKSQAYRYHLENPFFAFGDGLVYYAIIGLHNPKRIIEIGSGYSSALALDALAHFGRRAKLTCIEPYPAALKSLLDAHGNANMCLLEQKVQTVPMQVYDDLEAGDILFIDSSHVIKTGSDVCFELFDILPRLNRGVLVHFHDVFFPFEYPRVWVVDDRRAWNELYALRSFLMFNEVFRIHFFNHYFFLRFPNEANDPSTLFSRNCGGSLWLKRE